MAANKKKTTARKSGGTTRGTKKRAQQKKTQSIHREIIGAVLLLLAFFSLLGWFQVDAVLIKALCNVEKGLLGAGFYILPVIEGCIALMLFQSGERPVVARALLTAALAVVLGAIVQVFVGPQIEKWNIGVIKQMYQAGVGGPGGGAISGLLGAGLASCFSGVGAVLLLFLLFAGCLMAPLRMTPKSLILAIRNRPRPEQPAREDVDVAEKIVNHIAESQMARAEERRKARESFNVDLPVDDPLTPVRELPEQAAPTETEKASPGQFLLDRKKQDPEQVTIDELPERREDVMPLPLITDLIQKNQKVPEREHEPAETPEPVSVPGPVDVSEPENTSVEMPEFHPEDYHMPEPEETPEEERLPDEELFAEEDFQEEPDEPDGMEEPEPLPEEETPEIRADSPAGKAAEPNEPPAYVYPPMDLLNPSVGGAVDATEEMRLNSERLADTLRSFGIQPNIVNVTRGPTVTRYELQLNRGVKLSKITSLSEDIALALGATGVRISAIPEKISVVGIEVPNRAVSTVYAREVIDSREFASSKSKISFAVGKDIGGNRVIGNIAKLPHLLIAGTTGSGKSVCMNSLIISLLYKASPEEVRLIMIDPKMVELGIYNGIPHLLIPVVTDPKKAAGSLQWAVTEMMRRYSIMSESGTRDIASYNRIIEGNPERKKLPQIVVVIDELADLMLVAAKEVEESICRVAQMGRAAGVHLVIATQRPSANVITGLMKANIPSRIAFAVASSMESRIILDTGGAEKLVGRGDMLYAPLGEGKAKRVQGCFITDEEVQRVAEFVKQSGRADYSKEIMEHIERKAAESGRSGGSLVSAEPEPDDDRDELLYDAIDTVLELGQASVSVLQRKLKLGYSRASRIVDQMEEMGVVGPHKGSKPRDILVSKEKWEAVKRGEQQLNEAVPDEID